jgi:hypothetical protein
MKTPQQLREFAEKSFKDRKLKRQMIDVCGDKHFHNKIYLLKLILQSCRPAHERYIAAKEILSLKVPIHVVVRKLTIEELAIIDVYEYKKWQDNFYRYPESKQDIRVRNNILYNMIFRDWDN